MKRILHQSPLVIAWVVAMAAWLPAQSKPDQFAIDTERLMKAMSLTVGQTVADIGAGGGELTLELARVVGASGRVFATEINAERVLGVRKAAASAGLTNVTVLEGHATRTNLPERCCDALVIRFVYHHFADPAAMNASVFQSVKPGGHLAVIDFAPDGKEAATPADRGGGDTHGVTVPTVIRELRAAGFELVSQEQEAAKDGKGFLVVMRRPVLPNVARTIPTLRGSRFAAHRQIADRLGSGVAPSGDMNSNLDKFYDLIEEIKIAMMTTRRRDGHLESRPMANQKRAGGADLWFVTADGTGKVRDIEQDHHVNLAYYRAGSYEWVSASGVATLSRDRGKIHELYAPDWKGWFGQEGDSRHGTADDPRIVLIGVDIHAAVFLEVNKPKPVVLYELAKGWLTGERAEPGEMHELNEPHR